MEGKLIIKAPMLVIYSLESIRRRFIWGEEVDKNNIPWVKWDQVIAPKYVRELGVDSVVDLNWALLSKWKWLYKVKFSFLWIKVLFAIHCQ